MLNTNPNSAFQISELPAINEDPDQADKNED